MPDFNRFRTALLGGQPDRVPLAELKIEPEVKEQFLGVPAPDPADREATVRWEINFAVQAGYDYLRLPMPITYPEAKTSLQATYAADGRVRRRDWAESHKGLVTNEAEFEAFPWPAPAQVDCTDLDLAARLLPPGMRLATALKGGGIYERTWMMMGFETFCEALADQPALVGRIFARWGEFYWRTVERLAAHPVVGAIWMGDDLAYATGLMVSPRVYREHLFPWFRLIGETCRRRNLPFIYHSCGRLWEVIPDLLECGISALHPIEPKAMDIREVKAEYGKRLCLMGNIDLGYTLTRGTPAEVEAEVRQRIRDIAPGGGYCLGSSNSVTEYVPIANYRAMLEAVGRWGAYPISAEV